MDLTQKIKRFAIEDAGFDLVGISSAVLPEFYGVTVEKWILSGFAGDMHYMVRDGKKRAEPTQSLASARSVISLAVNYYHPEDAKPEDRAVGKISKYAYGADYHKVIEKRLKKFSQFLMNECGPGTEIKSYVDTGPLLEKAFAKEAGLGFFGKNTNIITRNFGSWVFLASLITNLDLVPNPMQALAGRAVFALMLVRRMRFWGIIKSMPGAAFRISQLNQKMKCPMI
jgi:epoxyqueuosine reductase